MRLVAVLGFSSAADGAALHAICAARLVAAEQVADPDAVLFSGAARHDGPSSEAELMRAAWHGADVPLHLDTSARTTAGNAAGVASLARQLGATEVVIVTSSWHAPRARALVRAALAGSGAHVRSAPAAGRADMRTAVRELACAAALPVMMVRARRGTRRPGVG